MLRPIECSVRSICQWGPMLKCRDFQKAKTLLYHISKICLEGTKKRILYYGYHISIFTHNVIITINRLNAPRWGSTMMLDCMLCSCSCVVPSTWHATIIGRYWQWITQINHLVSLSWSNSELFSLNISLKFELQWEFVPRSIVKGLGGEGALFQLEQRHGQNAEVLMLLTRARQTLRGCNLTGIISTLLIRARQILTGDKRSHRIIEIHMLLTRARQTQQLRSVYYS